MNEIAHSIIRIKCKLANIILCRKFRSTYPNKQVTSEQFFSSKPNHTLPRSTYLIFIEKSNYKYLKLGPLKVAQKIRRQPKYLKL